MSEKIKLSETVMLIDAAFLDFIVTDMRKYFSSALQRELPLADMSLLMTCLALDASVSEGKNEIQVLLAYDAQTPKLADCVPADLKTELNGVAFSSGLGEFSFASVPSEEMVSREELFLDLLKIVSDSADVKKMIVVSHNEEYGDSVTEELDKVGDKKEVIQFRMDEPDVPLTYRWEMLAFPILQALGVKGEEMN